MIYDITAARTNLLLPTPLDDPRALLLGPLKDGIDLGVREFGIAMDQGVLRHWHVSVLDLIGDFGE